MQNFWEIINGVELTSTTAIVRIVLSLVLGSLIGIERKRKGQMAGLRTFSLISMGACIAMMLSIYVCQETVGLLRGDPSRIAAQVISGIGFLGAGTIIVTGRQQIKGLTTAAGLWASACMGIAIGAGFYECVIIAFVLIFLCIRVLPIIDNLIQDNAMIMNLYVEFESLNQIGSLITKIKSLQVQIYDVEIDRRHERLSQRHSAVFTIRLHKHRTHTQILSALAELDWIHLIEEI